MRIHRVSGPMDSKSIRESCLSGEQSILRVLLTFRIERGDQNLFSHLDNSQKNFTVISPVIQNKIIDAVGDMIVQKIVERVKTAKYFSIL